MPHEPLQPIIISNRRPRRTRRKIRLGPMAWRVGLGMVAFAFAGSLLMNAAEPYTKRHHQKQETQKLLQSLAEAREQNRSLKLQIENLRTGPGLELEARKLGYVRKGEIPLHITLKESPKTQE